MTVNQVEILSEWFTSLSPDFMRQGNCQGMDTNIFFPYKGESNEQAMAACNGTDTKPVCPVRAECLEYALSLPSVCVGVWGGTSQKERRRIKAGLQGPQPFRWRE